MEKNRCLGMAEALCGRYPSHGPLGFHARGAWPTAPAARPAVLRRAERPVLTFTGPGRQHVLFRSQEQTFLLTSIENPLAAPPAAHPGFAPGEASSKDEGSVSGSDWPSSPAP